jgi:hypothetical protein
VIHDTKRLHRRARLLTLAAVLCVALTTTVASVHAGSQSGCASNEVRTHDEAVFGHFATRSAAATVMRSAAALGFKGIKIENDGCSDYEVEIDGADTGGQRSSFAREAAGAGFPVTFEQIAPPFQYHAGQMVGVVGRFGSVTAANALLRRLSVKGFQYLDVVFMNGRWLVVVPQVPEKNVPSLTSEFRRAGFNVLFQPGISTG